MDSGEGGRVSPKRSGMVVTGHPPPTGKDSLKYKGNPHRGVRGGGMGRHPPQRRRGKTEKGEGIHAKAKRSRRGRPYAGSFLKVMKAWEVGEGVPP